VGDYEEIPPSSAEQVRPRPFYRKVYLQLRQGREGGALFAFRRQGGWEQRKLLNSFVSLPTATASQNLPLFTPTAHKISEMRALSRSDVESTSSGFYYRVDWWRDVSVSLRLLVRRGCRDGHPSDWRTASSSRCAPVACYWTKWAGSYWPRITVPCLHGVGSGFGEGWARRARQRAALSLEAQAGLPFQSTAGLRCSGLPLSTPWPFRS
jgi:hypothetical protein